MDQAGANPGRYALLIEGSPAHSTLNRSGLQIPCSNTQPNKSFTQRSDVHGLAYNRAEFFEDRGEMMQQRANTSTSSEIKLDQSHFRILADPYSASELHIPLHR
jgi:hypothetical protein